MDTQFFCTSIQDHAPEIELLGVFEAGSRAWGFASTDSDYDVRFLYRHKKVDKYLQLHDSKDTKEFMTRERLCDFSGWDVKKALQLAMKSNVSLYEWSFGPITYFEHPFMNILRAYIGNRYCLHGMSQAYRGIAKSTYSQHIRGTGETTLKKFLYVIRPLLCVQYMAANDVVPPIKWSELLDLSNVDAQFRQAMHDLIDLKKNYPEKKTAPESLDTYLTGWCASTLSQWTEECITEKVKKTPPNVDRLNSIYRTVIGGSIV